MNFHFTVCFFTACGMWMQFSVWSNGCQLKGDNALLWSPGFAVHTAWDVLAIPAARPGCWLMLSLLLAHSPRTFLPSRAAPQPGWPSPYGCRRGPIPGSGLTWWHSVVTFLLIDSSSQSLWMAALPSTPGMPSMSCVVVWLISSLMSVSVHACMCICVWLQV